MERGKKGPGEDALSTKTTVEVDQIVIDAKKASRLAAWILSTAIAFIGFVAGGAWTVATWKVGIENHLQNSDDHMRQIDQKLDWIVTNMGKQNEEKNRDR